MTLRVPAERDAMIPDSCPSLAQVEVEPFRAEDVLAMVRGPHPTTIGLRPQQALPTPDPPPPAVSAVSISVRAVGKPRVDFHCRPSLKQDVEVTLAFAQPALDLILETTLFAWSAERAGLLAALGPTAIEAMQLPGLQRDVLEATLDLGFSPEGPRGRLSMRGACGVHALLPGDARCDAQPESGLDEELLGVRIGDV